MAKLEISRATLKRDLAKLRDLLIVSGVNLNQNLTTFAWQATGGSATVWANWNSAAEDLTPTKFVYRVPPSQRSYAT